MKDDIKNEDNLKNEKKAFISDCTRPKLTQP